MLSPQKRRFKSTKKGVLTQQKKGVCDCKECLSQLDCKECLTATYDCKDCQSDKKGVLNQQNRILIHKDSWGEAIILLEGTRSVGRNYNFVGRHHGPPPALVQMPKACFNRRSEYIALFVTSNSFSNSKIKTKTKQGKTLTGRRFAALP